MARIAALAAFALLMTALPVQATPGGFSDTDVLPGNYMFDQEWAQLVKPGTLPMRAPETHTEPSMQDLAQLAVTFVRPDAPGRFPVLVRASPYLAGGLENTMAADPEYAMRTQFVPKGYVVAYIPVRGTGDAGGCMEMMSAKEVSDVEQMIDWLAIQPWSNGKVGIIGLSYDGTMAWALASTGNPYVKTIVPMDAYPDLYPWLYMNGVDGLNALPWYAVMQAAYGAGGANRTEAQRVWGAACPAAIDLAAASATASAGQGRSAYWDERDWRQEVLERYEGSVLMVHGLRDFNVLPSSQVGFLDDLELHGIPTKLILGQWAHTFPDVDPYDLDANKTFQRHAYARMDWAEIQLHWFDYWLKGKQKTDLGPRVQIQDSAGHWSSETAWTPADAAKVVGYLVNGTISQASGPNQDLTVVGTMSNGVQYFTGGGSSTPETFYGVANEETCDQCAAFATPAASDAWNLVGSPRLVLNVTPSATEGTVGAWLFLDDNGTRRLVSIGGVDMHFPDGSDTPQTVTPGVPLQIKFQLEPVNVYVPPGAQVTLVIHAGGPLGYSTEPSPFILHTAGSTFGIEQVSRGLADWFTPP